jgi:hypothetical protein
MKAEKEKEYEDKERGKSEEIIGRWRNSGTGV